MPDYQHAREIPDDVFLAAVQEASQRRGHDVASRWDVEFVLAGRGDSIEPGHYLPEDHPGIPSKVVLAKARKLIRRRLLSGCECGCRGDWAVIDRA